MPQKYYVTTPIYYVNDRPHIGHCYTTLLADAMSRAQKLLRGPGSQVFFLTGTDEHADKVVTSAAAHDMTPIQWADRNAAEFRAAFEFCRCDYDDFIRTTEDRHKTKVLEYIRALQASGDVYLGDYAGWFDESQEEYLTETVAKESKFGPYTSPVTGKPLVKRTEKNYFFRLSKYQDRLRQHIESNPGFVQPESRRNEVMGRLRDGLQDIPISRAVTADPTSQWGIRMPDDSSHRIYVWIDALFNYLSVVDTPQRQHLWPADLHFIAKDILWFHAVIWPCMMMALDRPLPLCVYAHSYWVREGRKMSKSLGNFVTIEVLKAYAERFSIDAVRWYLLTQGPLGNTDADFSHAKFVETYNAELANGLGNCASRVGNMVDKYFGGSLPAPGNAAHVPGGAGYDFPALASNASAAFERALRANDLAGALAQGVELIRQVDGYINATAPFKLAKTIETDPAAKQQVATILYTCAEAIRVASLFLSPALVTKTAALWETWGCAPAAAALADLAAFGGPHALKPGQPLGKGEILFMRAKAEDPAPEPAQSP